MVTMDQATPITSERKKSGPKPKNWPPNFCDNCGTLIVGGWRPHRRKYCTLTCAIETDRASRKIVNNPDLFWTRVNKSGSTMEHVDLGPCWEWTGALTDLGYGYVGGMGAHRMAWNLVNGEIEDSKWVLHRCDNPSCVRAETDPESSHLYLGRVQENVRDMIERRRAYFQTHPRPPKVKKEKRSRAGILKIGDDGLLMLLALLAQTDLSFYWIGRELGISDSTVREATNYLGYNGSKRKVIVTAMI